MHFEPLCPLFWVPYLRTGSDDGMEPVGKMDRGNEVKFSFPPLLRFLSRRGCLGLSVYFAYHGWCCLTKYLIMYMSHILLCHYLVWPSHAKHEAQPPSSRQSADFRSTEKHGKYVVVGMKRGNKFAYFPCLLEVVRLGGAWDNNGVLFIDLDATTMAGYENQAHVLAYEKVITYLHIFYSLETSVLKLSWSHF